MDIGSLLSTAAAAGPPAKRGDSAGGHKSVVDGMKAGLRAHYVKTGKMDPNVAKAQTAAMYETNGQGETCKSQMVEDLKIGLRAHYNKTGQPINETTVAPSVGVGTERALGQPVHWGGGMPSRRKDKPLEKGGRSLRGNIQDLEKKLEVTLLGLSNRRGFTEEADQSFRHCLVDALADYIIQGDGSKLRDIKMQATLIESSKFIGEPAPETGEVLTQSNDSGARFLERMGDAATGSIVEMVATQLTSGMPLHLVRNNVAAAMQSTNNQRVRGTLMKAAVILAEL